MAEQVTKDEVVFCEHCNTPVFRTKTHTTKDGKTVCWYCWHAYDGEH